MANMEWARLRSLVAVAPKESEDVNLAGMEVEGWEVGGSWEVS